ncbi:uncharacterized protein KRP23_2304 [Phytophthora ramorum]|uniref:uncharacterized protein n=1 Tax=Phytophthora ramorum TaxID=164328 RepID=UPI00309A6DA3|nr:hypothetical protein KRP23_2304 [Phytophthora ramorum]
MSGKKPSRAVWGLTEEQALLELFEKAREDPSSCKGRGVSPAAWANIVAEINRRCGCTFVIDQIKSKYTRTMIDYELFTEVGGGGSLTDQDWDTLITARPENASRLRQFKESGFPHAEICRRIVATQGESTSASGTTSGRPRGRPRNATKRLNQSTAEEPTVKKVRIDVGQDGNGWGLREEKLLLFLCWRAKNDREVSGDEGLKPQGWQDVVSELNQHYLTHFTEKEVKEKYVELIQRYTQFKAATGYSGVADSAPKDEMDWERLIRERPRFYQQLQKLQEQGGFPHVEACSLIKGDTQPNGMGPVSVSEFLSTGALEIRKPSRTASPAQTSAHAIASAQASLSASALSYLLPATGNIAASLQAAANGHPSASQAGSGPGVGATPAVFTQELHDNLNMFLKTATAYLVMLINDHNQDNGIVGFTELLELFEKARQDPENRTGRGGTPNSWKNIAAEINRRCSSSFNVDQLQSKCSRLMMDYELFKDVGGEHALNDQDWDRIIREMPENASRLHRFNDSTGFLHADICYRIALRKEELTTAPLSGTQASSKRPDRAEKTSCRKLKDEIFANEGIQPQTWLEVTNDLNKHGKRKFDKKQVKAKYLQLMLSYD